MAELRYTYLLDVKDRASRQVQAANDRIARSTQVANQAMERQSTVAQAASRQIQTAGARQAAEWKQVARSAQVAERTVAQASTQASASVSRAVERQVAQQRKAGASYAQIAKAQKAAGVSARETAAAIEQSSVRETRAVQTAASRQDTARRGLLGGVRSQMKSMAGLAAGMGAMFATMKGYQFAKDAVSDVTDLAKASLRLANNTNLDVHAASQWVQIAKQRGISTQQLTRGFVTLARNQDKAAQGSKQQVRAFQALGISQKELGRLGTDELLKRVADGMRNLHDGTQRGIVAQQLFGRAAQGLTGILRGGSQGIRDLQTVIDRYGASLDKNGVKQAMKLVAEQRKLQLAMDGVKLTLGQALIPILARGARALSTFLAQMRTGKGAGGDFRRVLGQIWDGMKGVWAAIGPVVKALADFARQHPGLVKVAGGIVAVGVAVRGLRFAGAITGVNSLLRVLGTLARTRAGQTAAGAIVKALGGLRARLAAPLAAAASRIVGTISGAGVSGGAKARDAITGRLRGVRLPNLAGKFSVWGRALGIAGGAAIVGELSKKLDDWIIGNKGDRRSGGGSSGSKKLDDLLPFHLPGPLDSWLRGRKGGVIGFQAGGLVPAMVSPGEMIVHGNRAGMVPGQPVAADSVAMMLPVGAAVITGHGQQLLAQGATVGEAVARQAPHFATGGHVRGKLSWFGGPHDSQDSGRTALGVTTATPGVAVRPGDTWQTGRATLGSYWRIRTPNGRTAVLRQTDLGPNQSTGRRIDLTYSALGRLGYTEGNFPTDSVGVADLVRGGAAKAASYRLSGYAAALARRVGRSRVRAGILSDAFEQGLQQGEAGMTRARLRSMGDPVYRAISAAYRVPGDRIVRVAGRAAPGGSGGGGGGGRGGVLTRGIRATANSIARRWNVNGRVAEIAALAMQAFPGLTVSSGFRPGAITKSGNRSNHGFHRALDLAATGRRNLAVGAWLRRRFPPSFRGVSEGIFDANHDPTGQHGTHVHVAAQGGFFNRYRRGGIVPRFQAGGRVPRYTYATPGERGRVIRGDEFGVYGQPSRGFGAVLGGAMFPVVRASNAAFAKRFAALNAAIQNAADGKIAALRRGLLGAVRRGGSEVAVKRMQQAIDLIDRELGRRIGLLSRRIAARAAAADTRVARTDIGLRIRGVSADSPQGITERLAAERFRGDALHRTARDLTKQLRLAEKGRNLAKITEIRQEIADNQTAILDSRANQAELGRARAEQIKADRNAVYEYVAGMAGSKTSLAQTGLQTLELQQRLAGTYDTGGQARADYIRQSVVPDLQAEQAAIEQQRQEAVRQGNQQLAAQLAEALAGKGNDILQALLDVKDAAKETADNTDALKSLGGTLGFDFGGARFTDALVASGVGA